MELVSEKDLVRDEYQYHDQQQVGLSLCLLVNWTE